MTRVHIAWPWELGLGGEPEPPVGYVFLVDDSGSYLTDDEGAYIIEEING